MSLDTKTILQSSKHLRNLFWIGHPNTSTQHHIYTSIKRMYIHRIFKHDVITFVKFIMLLIHLKLLSANISNINSAYRILD